MSGATNNKLLYADNSDILVSDRKVSKIENTLQRELEVVNDWLINNKLTLHLGKTESILFRSRPRLKIKSALDISCKRISTEAKDQVKYLGAVLEQCLSDEKNMVTSVIQKANTTLKFFCRIQKFLNFTKKTNKKKKKKKNRKKQTN